VAALADDDPNLLAPVAEGLAVLGVEFAFGVLAEGALTVADLLDRRTRLGLVPSDAELARPAAERIIERYGALLTP
jgi:glycerol-3-phosphate dehydrogenase